MTCNTSREVQSWNKSATTGTSQDIDRCNRVDDLDRELDVYLDGSKILTCSNQGGRRLRADSHVHDPSGLGTIGILTR